MPVPIVFHPAYEAVLPDGHRFPMRKYGRLAEVISELGLAPDGFVIPDEASAELIGLAHDRSYVDQVFACSVPREIERGIGLPVDEGVVRRARASAGGTLLAATLALQHGLAGSTAGGSHHGQRRAGAGFCVFNDVAIAAKALRTEGRIQRALVVNLDVHQGGWNGGLPFERAGSIHLFHACREELSGAQDPQRPRYRSAGRYGGQCLP
jgi:acetoin utilization deacetylase AcuC-like enzyme